MVGACARRRDARPAGGRAAGDEGPAHGRVVDEVLQNAVVALGVAPPAPCWRGTHIRVTIALFGHRVRGVDRARHAVRSPVLALPGSPSVRRTADALFQREPRHAVRANSRGPPSSCSSSCWSPSPVPPRAWGSPGATPGSVTLHVLGATFKRSRSRCRQLDVRRVCSAPIGVLGYVALLPGRRASPRAARSPSASPGSGSPHGCSPPVAVPVLAAASGFSSLRRVARRRRSASRAAPRRPASLSRRRSRVPPRLRRLRDVTAAAGRLAAASAAVLLGFLAAGFGAMNSPGPVPGRGPRPGALRLAPPSGCSRPAASPTTRAARRVVGGLGRLPAGCAAVRPMFTSASENRTGGDLDDDLVTSAMFTPVIAFLLAAVSAGIQQASTVLDRRQEYAPRTCGMPALFARRRPSPAR